MADHEFFGTVSGEAATASDHFVQKAQLDSSQAYATSRANHTGTQPSSTISDFTTAVNALIQNVVGAAPDALNTLQEIADALGADPNFAATITGQITGLDSRIDTLEANTGSDAFKQDVGDATVSSFTITHNKGTQDCLVQVIRKSDFQVVYPVVKLPTANTVTVDFGTHVPGVGAYRVIINPL